MFARLLQGLGGFFRGGVARKAKRQQEVTPEGQMSIIEHIKEMRDHTIKSLIFFGVATVVTLVLMEPLIRFLRMPFRSFQEAHGKKDELMAIGLFEVITMNLKICLMMAALLTLPYLLYRFWLFISPALYSKEKRIVMPLLFASMFMFYSGVSFGFFVIVPMFLSSALEWASAYANIQLTVENYFSALSLMLALFGAIFEVPVILTVLAMVGIINSDMIAKNRKIVFLVCFVIGAILSPPDVVSQVLVSVPLYAMCELSVFSMRWIEKNRAQNNDHTAAEIEDSYNNGH